MVVGGRVPDLKAATLKSSGRGDVGALVENESSNGYWTTKYHHVSDNGGENEIGTSIAYSATAPTIGSNEGWPIINPSQVYDIGGGIRVNSRHETIHAGREDGGPKRITDNTYYVPLSPTLRYLSVRYLIRARP